MSDEQKDGVVVYLRSEPARAYQLPPEPGSSVADHASLVRLNIVHHPENWLYLDDADGGEVTVLYGDIFKVVTYPASSD